MDKNKTCEKDSDSYEFYPHCTSSYMNNELGIEIEKHQDRVLI